MSSTPKEKTTERQYVTVKSWKDLKSKVLEKKSQNVGPSDFHLVADIDYTTYTFSKRGEDVDLMYEIISTSPDTKYSGWGSEALVSSSIDGDKKEDRTVIFMDKYVKETYDYFIKEGMCITFITSRSPENFQNVVDELYALGIHDPDVMCVGSGGSKVNEFLKHRYVDDYNVIVLDDESRHLDAFSEVLESPSKKGFDLLLYKPY
jgi:hypothetical protein